MVGKFKEALEDTNIYGNGTNISFGDGTGAGSTDTIDSTSEVKNFSVGDKVRIQGSASNDGDYTITGVASSTQLLVAAGSFTTEAVGERITITQIPVEDSSPSETSHPNVNQMLCLAVVDYVKAMKAESEGDLTSKEYYIREFYSKLGDNEGNKRKMAMSFPAGPYAVR